MDGLTHGFRISFDQCHLLKLVGCNMPSDETDLAVVEEYLSKEANTGHIIGPLQILGLYVNRIGVIPEGHTSGRWKLISNLLFPLGQRIKDGIDPDQC